MIDCGRHTTHPPPAFGAAGTGQEDGAGALLVAIADRRDHSAFAHLFDRFAPRGCLRRLGAEEALAEDLPQEVMLMLWQPRATASTWIFTIAGNRCIDSIRRRQRETESDVYAIGLPADDHTERGLDLTQLERHLRRAVASLPSEQSQLIEHGYSNDQSQSALANQFDLPLGTVKARERLALDKLRRHLDPPR